MYLAQKSRSSMKLEAARGATNRASSILVKVCSACSKNPNTMDRLNSRSSSSSSISRICSKVIASMLSPRSGKPTEPSSLCWYPRQSQHPKVRTQLILAGRAAKGSRAAPQPRESVIRREGGPGAHSPCPQDHGALLLLIRAWWRWKGLTRGICGRAR